MTTTHEKSGRKPRMRRVESLSLSEISFVDAPAQAPAVAAIAKNKEAVAKYGDPVQLATDVVDGHQHGIEVYRSEDGRFHCWIRSATDSGGSDHTHSLIKNPDGSYSVTANSGHTHEIDQSALRDAVAALLSCNPADAAAIGKAAPDSKAAPGQLEGKMPNDQTTNDKDRVVAELEKRLALAEARAEMTDIEKAHFDALRGTARRDAFIEMSSDERATEVAKSAERARAADPVEYTTSDGLEVRKSAGAKIIAALKEIDVIKKANAQLVSDKIEAELKKRADDDLGNVAGSQGVRVALLKAVDSIENEEDRAGALAILKAANAAAKSDDQTIGLLAGGDDVGGSGGEDRQSAESKLHKMAMDAVKKDPTVDYHDAYHAAGRAHPQLLAKALGGSAGEIAA